MSVLEATTKRKDEVMKSSSRGLSLTTLLAVAARADVPMPGAFALTRRRNDDESEHRGYDMPAPVNTGRRAEKDARAIEKAEAKRKRKAEKRLRAQASNIEVTGSRAEAHED